MNAKRPGRLHGPAIATIAALGLVAAGCGSDDQSSSGGEGAKPAKVAIELSGSGRDLSFDVPKSVKGGLAQIEFTNSAKGSHGAQLVRAEAGHTAEAALEAANAWGEQGKPLPDWVHTAGGVGDTPAGETASVTQQLPAGEYMVVDLESETSAGFEVRGTGATGEPSAQATIGELEYEFQAKGLKAGSNPVLIDNRGSEPHFVLATPIKQGRTIADVREFVRSEKGEPPIDEAAGVSTAVIDGGEKQAVQLDLESGNYALLCFVPDRKGGPPHAFKGMVSQAVVR